MQTKESINNELAELIRNNTNTLIPFPTETKPELIKLNGMKAILFDVYGTMLISGTGDIGIAEEKQNEFPISRILADYGLEILVDEESLDDCFSTEMFKLIKEEHKQLKRKGIEYPEVDIREIWNDLIIILNNENYIDGQLSEINLLKAALSYECLINPVWPMPGVDKVLNYIYTRTDLHLGIVSNAQFYTEPLLRELVDFHIGEKHFNENILHYSYKEREAKPSADFFNRAVLKLKKMYNIDPHEILYIGNDMLNDVYTANKCGCKTALFAGDKRSLRLRASDTRCKSLKPDIIITDLEQLIDLI